MPHSEQNLPRLSVAPQLQVQPSTGACILGACPCTGAACACCIPIPFCCASIWYSWPALIPPTIFAMFIPANAIIGPVEVLDAAIFIASACAAVMVAAAIPVLRSTAVLCRSAIVFASSSGIFAELILIVTISIPRSLVHRSESSSFKASVSSSVCAGISLGRTPFAEILASAGCNAVNSSAFIFATSSLLV